MITSEKLEKAYQEWAEELVADGYQPFIMSFMFDQMRGSFDRVAHEMLREVERVYERHLTRVVRKPNSITHLHERPIWLCSLDRPVYKRVKRSLNDVLVNDGLHGHAIGFYWPRSRLREGVVEHFERRPDLYIGLDHPLSRIEVEPITHDVGNVVSYIRKSVRRGLVGEEGVLELPIDRATKLERRVA